MAEVALLKLQHLDILLRKRICADFVGSYDYNGWHVIKKVIKDSGWSH